MDTGERSHTFPQPGQEVRIIDGPFNDFGGVVESVNDEERKALVAVSFFGRSTLASFFFHQIEPLGDFQPRTF